MSRSSSLRQLLFKPELQSLAGGKRWNTLVFLSLIYGFSLFSLGSGQQIQAFLEEKMDDPYVQHLLAEVPATSCPERRVTSQLVENTQFQSRFNVASIEPMAIAFMNFQEVGKDLVTLKTGGMESEEHPLWSMLISKPDLFLTDTSGCHPFTPFTETGVILSEKAAIQLGLAADWNTFQLVQWVGNAPGSKANLPVLGVMKSLPMDLDAVLSGTMIRHLKSAGLSSNLATKSVRFVNEAELTDPSLASQDRVLVPGGAFFSANTIPTPAILKSARKIPLLDMTNSGGKLDEEFLMFTVKDLSRVRGLAEELVRNPTQYGCQEDENALEIDLTTVESKENLSIFSSFAFLLSAALVVIALILIVNYTGAILRLHINKNRRNLGTLMAFGYQNGTITKLYLLITATILGLSFAISYLVVWPIGYFGFGAFLGAFGLSETLADVHFAHIPLYYSIPLFVLLPLVVVSIRIRRQLKATPGDLVYDR